MKKLIEIAFMLALFSCNCHEQDSMTFKVECSPETIYTNTIEQKSYSETLYRGSDDFIQSLKDNGVDNPTITNTGYNIETILNTGKATDGKHFPLILEIVKTTNSDGTKALPDGMLIYGHGSVEPLPKLDSVVSGGVSKDLKLSLLNAAQYVFKQLDVPERKLKIGESFSVKLPFSFPIATETVEMFITTSYTLLSIVDGIAHFNVSQECTMNNNSSEYAINVNGNGTGNLLYDVANNYPLKNETHTEIDMNVNYGDYILDLMTKNDIIQTSKMSDHHM